MLTLRVRVDGAEVELVGFGPHVIGRLPESHVHVEVNSVSRRHAQLTFIEGRWILEDLGSGNGSYVAGRRIDRIDLTSLGDGVVKVGDPIAGASLQFTIVPAAPAPGFRPFDSIPDLSPQYESAPSSEVGTIVAPSLVNSPESLRSDTQFGIPTIAPSRMIRAYRDHGDLLTIGRAEDNTIVLHDLTVSRHHAELRRRPDGSLRIHDLVSHNGTFVDGQPIAAHDWRPGEVLAIGSRFLQLGPGRIEEYSATDHFPLAGLGLRVMTADGTVLLDDVSFSLAESSMMAIIGPSGAGKSTLLNALTGLRPASEGRVLCGGSDLYTDYESLRRRIGYVPQDDLVQPELTVLQSLRYAARLRFAPDVTTTERDARVTEVMDELGLTKRAHVQVGSLSGGQRKRVSMGLELLTKPALLFLDEPTSGLDPGYERNVMSVLRRLADGGRTIVLVTHSVESLQVCDRVLCLSSEGRTAWFGPPNETTAHFGKGTYQEIFQALDASRGTDAEPGPVEITVPDATTDWPRRFADSDAHRRYVTEPLATFAMITQEAAAPRERTKTERTVTAAGTAGGWFRQLATLTARYARVVRSDRRTVTILVVGAPLVGLLLLLRLPPDQLAPLARGSSLFSQAPLIALIVSMGITQMGASTAVREIVKERAVLRREQTLGLSMSAYVVSKMIVLGCVALIQSTIIVLVATARQGGPTEGLVLPSGRLELVIVGALTALGAMASGLLVSALVGSLDRVTLILPALLGFHLLATSGEVMVAAPRVPVLEEARFLSTARWGFAALASTIDVEDLAVSNRILGRAPTLTVEDLSDVGRLNELIRRAPAPRDLRHERSAWLRSIAALVGLTIVMSAATVLVLRRLRGAV